VEGKTNASGMRWFAGQQVDESLLATALRFRQEGVHCYLATNRSAIALILC
jgi:hypothetical protein